MIFVSHHDPLYLNDPSDRDNALVRIEVGWLLQAAWSFFISQRDAWKSSMKI
jgi:hypothetical protein